MADKPSEFMLRSDSRLRFGYRVWRAHTMTNKKKNAWLDEAIEEKLEREEPGLPALDGPKPLRLSELDSKRLQ